MKNYGGVEAGGTKFVCAVGSGPEHLERTAFPTTTPEETIGRAIEFFRSKEPIHALGVASFGPVDLNPRSETYGYITSTPKSGWANTNLAGILGKALGTAVRFDTDVNAAALAEVHWGSARGLDDVVYITVGTGIGGGAMVGGQLVHGLVHPEMGHIRIPHDRTVDDFAGICPYHGDCLEGLACGPAIEARWKRSARELPPDHEAWALEARYLAAGVVNLMGILSPRRVIMGGGVMDQQQLFPLIRDQVRALMNGYIAIPEIGPPALGNNTGVLGGIALAMG